MNPSLVSEPIIIPIGPILRQLDVSLLTASIASNDTTVRSYHEKSNEVERLKADIASITASAGQVKQLYELEKLEKERFHKENMGMRTKFNEMQRELNRIRDDKTNSDTLLKQTIADLEAKKQNEKRKYLDLCRIVVDQGNILQLNSLSTQQLTRKCTLARETLELNGLHCEKVKSPKKKQDPNRIKSKTICTMTDPMPDPPQILLSTPVETCDRSTQYQQSKATRSTCTSTFISFTDAFTTMQDEESQDYFNPVPNANVVQKEVDAYPTIRSPIPEEIISKMAQSTQTQKKEYCTRETLTTINNVRKPIDYVRMDSPVSGVWPEKVKKEDISSAFGSMSNTCWACLANKLDLSLDAELPSKPSLSQLWQLMGQIIFAMIGTQKSFGSGNQATTKQSSMQRMQNHLQTLIKDYAIGTDVAPDEVINESTNDAMDLDEHSRDSIESYNSGRIIISEVRDSSEVLRESQAESTKGVTFNVDDRRTKKVNGPMVETNKNLEERLRAQSPHCITVRNVASGSEKIPEQRVNSRSNSPIVSTIPKIVVSSNGIVPEMEISGDSNIVVNDFKIPKRKSSDRAAKSNAKKRKSAKSATNEKELMTSLFGEDEPSEKNTAEDDQIRQIIDFFKIPSNIVSPIKDPENLMTDLNVEPMECVSPVKDLEPELYNSDSLTQLPKNLTANLDVEPMECISPIKELSHMLVNPEILVKHPKSLLTDLNVDPMEPMLPIKELNSELVSPKVIAPMPDLNDKPIKDPVIEKPMTDLIETPTDDMEHATIEEPAIDLSEEPKTNLTVNRASDSLEQLTDIKSPTADNQEADNTMEHDGASYIAAPDILPISSDILPISSDGIPTEISPESTKIQIEPEIYYYSPASPKPESHTQNEPRVIPLETLDANQTSEDTKEIQCDSSESEINQLIQEYSPKFARTIASSSMAKLSIPDSYLMASLRNAIERYCMSKEWTSETVTKCLNKMLSQTCHVKHLAMALLEVVEDTKEILSLEFTPPSPALPPSIQRCILLYSRLTHNLPTFSEYFKVMLERRMFVFHSDPSAEALTNLTHLYIAINDIDQSSNPANMRLFIYKCLYYYTYKCIPLVFTVIMAHPFILPHANSVEFLTDPLSKAIVTALTSITYTMEKSNDKSFKKTEMFLTLKSRFGYFADKVFPVDGTIQYCIDCIQNDQLTNIDYALILLAKRQGYEYAIKNIIHKYMIPLLHRYFADDLKTNTQHDQQIVTILFVISSIAKTSPSEDGIDDFVNLLAVALNATDRQIIQEAAISGLCQLSRFGTKRIYTLISVWKPNYIKSKRITAILSTIVYKKPMHFWFDSSRIDIEHSKY